MVVTDGFTGNVALKTGEGALKLIGDLLRQVFRSSLAARIAYLLARPGLDRLREWLDPRRYNGAVMLGLNGVVVKSHGGTDAQGFAHAMDVAMDMVVHRFNDHIREDLAPNRRTDGRCRADERPRQPDKDGRRAAATPRHRSVGKRCHPLDPRRRRRATCLSAWSATTNSSRTVETSDEWIRERTGIRQRHIAAPHETAAFMGTAAARAALADAGAEPAEVDAIILATSTPDQAFPATALRVQAALGVTRGLRLRPRGRLRRVHLRARRWPTA